MIDDHGQEPATHRGPGAVEVGFFSFTEITDPAQHRAYNEWHQLDHLPEQYPLPGVVWGQRWVRTPACQARTEAVREPFDRVHYVTCYLMTAPVGPTLKGFVQLGADLRHRDRFFEARKSHLSGPFNVTAADAAPSAKISSAAVPFRPNRGAYVALWEQPPDGDPHIGAAAPVGELLDLDGVAGVWQFAAEPREGDSGFRSPGHQALMVYLDRPPLDVSPSVAAVLDRARLITGRGALLAGPVETITPWQWDWFEGDNR